MGTQALPYDMEEESFARRDANGHTDVREWVRSKHTTRDLWGAVYVHETARIPEAVQGIAAEASKQRTNLRRYYLCTNRSMQSRKRNYVLLAILLISLKGFALRIRTFSSEEVSLKCDKISRTESSQSTTALCLRIRTRLPSSPT